MAATTTGSPSDPNPTPQPHDDEDPNPQTLDPPHSPQPQPILLTDDPENPSPSPHPPSITSPRNTHRRNNKRKKTGSRKTYKRKRPTKKIQTLTETLNPIPFSPPKPLISDLVKHDDVLKRLGLYEFSKIEFDSHFRTDLLVQLIGNYDAKKRCSYVNDVRVSVNRADLARALKLPPAKPDKGGSVEEVDLDSEVFSDEAIVFVEEFVANWLVFGGGLSGEMASWSRCVRDGHPEKLDPASLVWYCVEKELSQDKLVDCVYAPHLQYLMRSQRESLFKDDDEDVEDDVDESEKVDEKDEAKVDEKVEEEKVEEKDEAKVEEKVAEKDGEEDEKAEKEEVVEEKEDIVEEQKVESNVGADVEGIAADEEVKNDDEVMADGEECKEAMEEQGEFKNVFGDHFLQRCQSSGLNDFEQVKGDEVENEQIEQVKVEEVEVEDEQIEQVKVEEVEVKDEQIEQVKVEEVEVEDEQVEQVEDEDEEEEEEEEGGERMDEGFDMEANDDSFDRDGLTDNFLQGVETSHNVYNNHGMSSMDLFGSRDDSFMSHGGPSFYKNGAKRLMEPEEDIHIHNLDQNNKRLRTDDVCDPKQNDINFCFDQMQQLMQKAMMIHESKERSYENLQYSQQVAIEQLQERQQLMDMIIKSKDEELEKKHAEVFRLERELYLMGDLLSGYRKALNDTRVKFSEYRKRFVVKEEPLYKDAGPGGLVLSTREIEKQRLKQEEEMTKLQIVVKKFEEECVYQLELQNDRILPIFDKLVSMESEVQRLKEIAAQPKETKAPSAEMEVEASVEPEENEKSVDVKESTGEPEGTLKAQAEVHENDAAVESVPADADESEEKGGGEEH